MELHWLLIRYRIIFKIPLLMFKALNGKAPSYLTEYGTAAASGSIHAEGCLVASA
jgi:hypothetical protein